LIVANALEKMPVESSTGRAGEIREMQSGKESDSLIDEHAAINHEQPQFLAGQLSAFGAPANWIFVDGHPQSGLRFTVWYRLQGKGPGGMHPDLNFFPL
jgi:hypothetical protein